MGNELDNAMTDKNDYEQICQDLTNKNEKLKAEESRFNQKLQMKDNALTN